MFVCVCHAVTVAEVEAAVDAGARTREEVTRRCGAGGDCGACHGDIERIIEQRAARTLDHASVLVPAERLHHRAA